MKKLLALLGGMWLLTGCASIVNGTTQRVGISSMPTGAIVSVDGAVVGNTPMFVDLKRKEEHIVTIELPGFQKAQLTVTQNISGWVLGNLAFGGLLGLGIDYLSGGIYVLTPEQLNAELKRQDATASVKRDGMVVVTVMKPDPAWSKLASLAASRP